MQKVVLLEGGEGTGKTSLAQWLAEAHNFENVKLPTPGSDFESVVFGQIKNGDVVHKHPYGELQRASAAILDMETQYIKHSLDKKPLVFDRGILSTYAYQGPMKAEQALSFLQANQFIRHVTDIVILDTDLETGLGREQGKNAFSEKDKKFHAGVYEAFRYLYKMMEATLLIKQIDTQLNDTLDYADKDKLLQNYVTEGDRPYIPTPIQRYTSVSQLQWDSLQTVTIIDTTKNNLNSVKQTLRNTLFLP
jgi:thymidylate kinase